MPVPPPPRAYEVAVTQRVFVDPTRGTPPNGDAPALPQRTLPVELWTPVGQGPFPLVLFVHGSSGFRTNSSFLTSALARDGYQVAAADFPLTAISTPGGASDWHAEDQLGDLRFLADQLGATSYSVVGHSTGGTIALLAAQAPDSHDARLKASVVLSGDSCFLADSIFSTRAVPMLYVSATRDLLVPAAPNGARAFALSKPPRMHATLLGGTHLFFTDLQLPDDLGGAPTTPNDPLALTFVRYGGGGACVAQASPGPEPQLPFPAQHDLVVAVVRGFLDEAIRGEPFDGFDDPRVLIAR